MLFIILRLTHHTVTNVAQNLTSFTSRKRIYVEINAEKGKVLLLYAYIVPFVFWMFDVFTTFYAINYLGIAGEMNPLGWPLGAIGALIFYVPAYIFTYALLFRLQGRYPCAVAVMVTMLSLGLGIMNLMAGVHNLAVVKMGT